MRKLRFTIPAACIRGCHDCAYISDGEDPFAALRDAVLNSVHLDVHVTIGKITMAAAMWEDPAHWAEDWAAKLGVDYDDVEDAVAALLANAMAEYEPRPVEGKQG